MTFGNYAKVLQADGAGAIRQIFKTSQVLFNCASSITCRLFFITAFSLLSPPGGLFFLGLFKEGGGAYLREGGIFISWKNYKIIFQHKEMCVKQLCILTILTQL